jgi:hypothetical protein
MKPLISTVALFLLLTPAIAQQAEQPVADQQETPSTSAQPAPEQPGLSQAAAQAQAQADEEQTPESQPAQAVPAPAAAGEQQQQAPPMPQPAEQQNPAAQQNDAGQQNSNYPAAEQQQPPAAPPAARPRPPQPNSAQQYPDSAPSDDATYPPQPPPAPPIYYPQQRQREQAVVPGIPPRAEASAYPAYREHELFSVGARLLSPKEVEQKFSTPLGKHYLVVEVGFFPANGQPIVLRTESFTLRAGDDNQAFFPATPQDIADALSGRNGSRRNVGLYPAMGVGYENGGWGRGGVTGVGVGVGGGPYQRRGMPGGNYRVMETELRDKSLPAATVTQPVAGYLYYPLSGKRAKEYKLEITRKNGEVLSLPLPAPKN